MEWDGVGECGLIVGGKLGDETRSSRNLKEWSGSKATNV